MPYKIRNLKLKKDREIHLYQKLMALYFKGRLSCQRCGENRVAALQFHHRDPSQKEKSPTRMFRQGCSYKEIMLELNKCDVLCANCHSCEHTFWSEEEIEIMLDKIQRGYRKTNKFTQKLQNRDFGTIKTLYEKENLSTSQIGQLFNVRPESISDFLRKRGVCLRDKNERGKLISYQKTINLQEINKKYFTGR
jgi:predicted HTH domain antitoxin